MLEPVDLPTGTLLFEAQSDPRYAHFITSGIASIVTVLAGGDAVEVGLVSREGVAEKLHLLGPQTSMIRCFMQVGGTALRMEFKKLEECIRQSEPLRRLVLRQIQQDALTLSQLCACNRLHDVEERMARWLLMVQDRTGDREIRLTQEFLAEMLGARRSTVNLAAGSLQRAGVIEYRRSRILITNRDLLEGCACECYPIMRRLLADLYKEAPAA